MKMVFIKFKPDGKEYGFGVPEDYKGSAGLKSGSWVRVPVPGCRKKMLRVVVRVAETATPPEGLKMIGYSGRQIAQTANKKARRAAHQGGIIYLAKKAKAEKRAMLGGRPIDLAWEAEKAAWIEDDLDIEPYLAKGYNTDEGLPKLTELRLGMRMGFDESSYDDPTLPLHIIRKRRVHQLRDWAREQGLLPPMYYEDPVHGIDKEQLRELLIGIANGIMPDTYGLKLIKLHKCGPRVLREMRLARQSVDGRSLRSQCFTVSYNADLDCFIFDVYGYGHGCGMSQWGAIGYARNGWGYQDILTHYFVGTTITTY